MQGSTQHRPAWHVAPACCHVASPTLSAAPHSRLSGTGPGRLVALAQYWTPVVHAHLPARRASLHTAGTTRFLTYWHFVTGPGLPAHATLVTDHRVLVECVARPAGRWPPSGTAGVPRRVLRCNTLWVGSGRVRRLNPNALHAATWRVAGKSHGRSAVRRRVVYKPSTHAGAGSMHHVYRRACAHILVCSIRVCWADPAVSDWPCPKRPATHRWHCCVPSSMQPPRW